MQVRLLIVAPLALLLFLASPAGARRIPVFASQTHLSQTLATAQPGDTLNLPSGELRLGGQRLPDGITVLGDPAGTVLKAKGRQSLFVIEGATVGVTLANLEIKGARSREAGGAIRARDSRVTLRGVTIRDCRSTQEGGALFAEGGRLEITDCQFFDNRATLGGAIAQEPGEAAAEGTCRLLADNVLFVGNRAATGGALASEVPVVVNHGTFVGNRVQGARAGAAVCAAQDSLFLRASILAENRGGSPGSGVLAVADTTRLDLVWNCFHNNSAGDFAGPVAAFEGRRGNQSRDPQFVDASRGDYRLHWLSPMLDRLGGESDFDLTRGDLGWQPAFVPRELVELPADGHLPQGHYTISADRVLQGPGITVEDGTVIRMEGTNTLTLDPGAGPLVLGRANGARTALVGAVQDRTLQITLGPAHGLVDGRIAGVLFNQAPIEGYLFRRLRGLQLVHAPEYRQGIECDTPTVHFSNSFQSSLWLLDCEGARISGLEVQPGAGKADHFGAIRVVGGAVGLDKLRFQTSFEMQNELLLLARCTRATVENCQLQGGQSSRINPLHQLGGVVAYRNNRFLNMEYTALVIQHGTARLDHGANNSLVACASGTGKPLIRLHGGRVEMTDGGNRFINGDVSWATNPFVADSLYTGGPRDWSGNAWGHDETHSFEGKDMNGDPAAGLRGFVPRWADASRTLSAPPSAQLPSRPPTPDTRLAAQARERMDHGELRAALSLWIKLLVEHPLAADTPEATEYLKSLGRRDPGIQAIAKAGLLHGATSARDVGDAWLSATQFCYAQCVEAYYGDREGAEAVLDSCVTYGSSTLKDVAELAILEIATYPEQGGNEAVGDQAALQRSVARQNAALKALVAWRPGAPAAGTTSAILPKTFHLGRIYPNPFNPRTTIELAVAQAGQIRVTVVNLLGQQVAVLADGWLDAGTHHLSFDGAALATGVYFVRAEQGNRVDSAKVLLVK